LAKRLAAQFAEATSAAMEPGNWSAEERQRIPDIVAQKYANPEWNGKR
jgi:hypothetical protein